MKKTAKIHLVLVTALVAACNRVITPTHQDFTPLDSLNAIDTTYYQYPLDYFNFYFSSWPYAYRYRPASLYRRGAYWHNHVFVVRGGFGRAAASTAS